MRIPRRVCCITRANERSVVRMQCIGTLHWFDRYASDLRIDWWLGEALVNICARISPRVRCGGSTLLRTNVHTGYIILALNTKL